MNNPTETGNVRRLEDLSCIAPHTESDVPNDNDVSGSAIVNGKNLRVDVMASIKGFRDRTSHNIQVYWTKGAGRDVTSYTYLFRVLPDGSVEERYVGENWEFHQTSNPIDFTIDDVIANFSRSS